MNTAPKKPWGRSSLPRLLNLLLWLSFCALTGTGLLLGFRLPPGSRGGRGLEFLGLDRHQWGDLHSWISYVFIGCILLHLALHWRWLWQVASRKRAWPMLAGFGLGIALLLFLAFSPVQGDPDERRQPRRQAPALHHP